MSAATMRAVRIHAHGGADALVEEQLPVPEPGPGEALVKVAYAGVNFIDIYKRTGLYKVPLPSIMGEEGAGIVESVGTGESDMRSGDRVAWTGVLGAYAEYAVVPDPHVGSRTRSPGSVHINTHRCTTFVSVWTT